MIPKFRAWDKNDKVMIYNVNPLLDSEGNLECIIFDYTLCGYDFLEIELEEYTSIWGHEGGELPYILMQSTGLKDKNGVEVYLGDIIKCSSGCPHEVIFKLEHGGNVLGGMPTFYLSDLDSGYQWTNKEEVVGNIYDNPELLEGE